MAMLFLLPLLVVVVLALPLVPIYKGITTGKKAKHAVAFNLIAFFGVCALAVILPVGGFVSAAEPAAAAATAAAAGITIGQGLGYLAAALSTGISCVGAGIAVAAAAPAAIGACSEDSQNFGRSLIFIALGEGIAIYGLVISILIITNL